jgi:hypothetical protein
MNTEVEKICTGCGRSSLNLIPKEYLACCPDNKYVEVKNTKPKELTNDDLISVVEKIYKHVNPKTDGFIPSGVYELIMEKWYPEFQKVETDLDFFDWCLIYKQDK